jgi:uncharacterized protein (DUF342 family)
MKSVELEDELSKSKAELQRIKKEQAKLTKKAEMGLVFEKGLGDMREIYEKEVAMRQQIEKEYMDLQTVQKNLKVTWINDKLGQFGLLSLSIYLCFYLSFLSYPMLMF